jgi:hypothetical protein
MHHQPVATVKPIICKLIFKIDFLHTASLLPSYFSSETSRFRPLWCSVILVVVALQPQYYNLLCPICYYLLPSDFQS